MSDDLPPELLFNPGSSSSRRDRDVAWYISRDVLAIVDQDGIVIDVNPAWTEVLGATPEETIGKHLAASAHLADAEVVGRSLSALTGSGPRAEFEGRFKTSDGNYRLLAARPTKVRDRIYLAGRDISGERERHIALHDSRDFARLALSAVKGVGAWTYEVSSDRFFCDAAVSELYGIDPAQAAQGIRREHFLANVHPDDRSNLRSTMSGGLLKGGDLELEYRICHPDGSIRHVLSRGTTYFNESGVPTRRTGVGIDTTSQRELEQQLRQSQKMEAVGHLTGGIAHDFNNMLQGVIGPLELSQHLAARGRAGELDRFVAIAIASARRAAALTHRLLAFSRKQPLAPQSFDVRELICSLEELVRQTANKNISFRFSGGVLPCMVRCDTNQLESALLNLAINACDAMPEGGVLGITATLLNISDDDALSHEGARAEHYVQIAVSDTGCGMSPEIISQVFEPFFTTKPLGRGTGLGLSMVYGFVGQSGGFVAIESVVDRGTTVSLCLPKTDIVDPTTAVQVSSIHSPADVAGETVLVVDDDEIIRALLAELFEQSGYKALVVQN